MTTMPHIRLIATVTAVALLAFALASGAWLTMAQSPDESGTSGTESTADGDDVSPTPDPDAEDGVEGENVHGCDTDPRSAECPPREPTNLRLTASDDDLTIVYQHQIWYGTPRDFHHWVTLYRSSTRNGTYTLHRSLWHGIGELKISDVNRNYYYKYRVKRCRSMSSSTSDCGTNTSFSPIAFAAPEVAENLKLENVGVTFSAKYDEPGTSNDLIDVDRRTSSSSASIDHLQQNINGSGFSFLTTRGTEYRFRVKRCIDANRADCGEWSGWSAWLESPELPRKATGLDWTRSERTLTAKYNARGPSWDLLNINGRVKGSSTTTYVPPNARLNDGTATATQTKKIEHSVSLTRGNEYRFRIKRCTDKGRMDCGGDRDWSSWSDWALIPKLPGTPSISVAGDDLTVSYTDTGTDYEEMQFEYSRYQNRGFTDYNGGTPSTNGLSNVETGRWYKVQVRGCVERRTDCTPWSVYSTPQKVEVPAPRKPSIESGANGTSLIVSFNLDRGYDHKLSLSENPRANRWDQVGPTVSLSSPATKYTFSRLSTNTRHRVTIEACKRRETDNCSSAVVSASKNVSKAPPPNITSIADTDQNDLTIRYNVPTWRDGTATNYEFRLSRSEKSSGRYSSYTAGTTPSSSPHKFNDVHTGYFYKASARRCSNASPTNCGNWSSWSSAKEVEAITRWKAPTNLELSATSATEVSATFTRSSSPTRSTHYYAFELMQADTRSGTYSRAKSASVSSGASVSFRSVTTGKWYKVRGKRCESTALKRCGDWSNESSAVKAVSWPALTSPTISSGANGTSVVAKFSLVQNYTFKLTLYSSEDQKRYQNLAGSATPAWPETTATFTGLDSDLYYQANFQICRSGDCSDGVVSNAISISKAPAPRISSITLTNQDDLTVNYTVPNWKYSTGTIYDFRIRRAESSTGEFNADYKGASTPSSSPHKFNNVHTGYFYKASARRCSDSAKTNCGDWSSLPSAKEVPALSEPLAPTNLRLSIVSLTEVKSTFTGSTSIRPVTHYYEFDLLQADSQSGDYEYSESANLTTGTSVSFTGVTTGKWYKVRGKRCETSAHKRCGPWSTLSNSVNPVAPNPTIKISGFRTSITIGAGLGKSVVVNATGLDRTKSYMIKFGTAKGTNDAAGVLKFDRCDASTSRDSVNVSVPSGAASSGPVFRRLYGCEAGTDTLKVNLVEGVISKSEDSRNVTVTPVPVPTGIRANGHSPGSTGQVELRWTADARASGHEYRLALADDPNHTLTVLNEDKWGAVSTMPTDSVISGLRTKRLYAFRLRAIRGGARSSWSEIVYTFPTRRVPKYGDSSEVVELWGESPRAADLFLSKYQGDHEFSYVICLDSFPEEERTAWTEDIRKGIATWENTVRWNNVSGGSSNIIRVVATESNDCATRFVDKMKHNGEYETFGTSFVRLESNEEVFEGLCGSLANSDSCVPEFKPATATDDTQPWPADVQPTIRFRKRGPDFWSPGAATVKSGGLRCSNVVSIVAHEAGHAFGLGHPPETTAKDAIAGWTPARFCEPQPLDIAAMMSIYQSEFASASNPRGND